MGRGIGTIQGRILNFFNTRSPKHPVVEGILGFVVYGAKEMTRAQRLSLLRALKTLATKGHPLGYLKNEFLQQYVIYRTDNKTSCRAAKRLARFEPYSRSQLLAMELERIIPRPEQIKRVVARYHDR